MTLKIIHKNNTSAGQAPAPSDLDIGEIAINAADAELYTKDNVGNIRKFQNTTTGTADGVQFTQAGTGAVQRTVESKLQDVVSVLDFIPESQHAAIKAGTSTYDCTDAVYAASQASTSLIFPPGQYLVSPDNTRVTSGNLYFLSKSNVYIYGYGATLKHPAGSSLSPGIPFIQLTSTNNVTIAGLTFDGNRTNQTGGYDAIRIAGGENINIKDCKAINVRNDGIYIRASSPSNFAAYPKNVSIANFESSDAGRNGISVIGVDGLYIQNAKLNDATTSLPKAGIDLEPNISDIYGIRNVIIDGIFVSGNDGDGILVTGNSPANPGETPFCLNVKVSNVIASSNGKADCAVFRAQDFSLDGYTNDGQATDPARSGLIYIQNTAKRASISNLSFSNCLFPTDSKSLVYIDSTSEEIRKISNVYADTCTAIVIGGAGPKSISDVTVTDCTASDHALYLYGKSNCNNISLTRSAGIIADGVGFSINNITAVDPVGSCVRLFTSVSKASTTNLNIYHTGTPSTHAILIQSASDCVFSNWNISDSAGYWNATTAYNITPASLASNAIVNVQPIIQDSFYETGTYTMTLHDARTGGNQSATTKTAEWVRIGKFVTVTVRNFSNIDSTGMTTGNLIAVSVPFPFSGNFASGQSVLLDSFTLGGGRTQASILFLGNGDSRAVLYQSGSGLTATTLQWSSVSSGVSDITQMTFTYSIN